MLYAIGVLQSKKQEIIGSMTDTTKTDIEKLSLTMMCDEIDEAIAVLNTAFFKRNT